MASAFWKRLGDALLLRSALGPAPKPLPGGTTIEAASAVNNGGKPARPKPTPMEIYLQDVRNAEQDADRGILSAAAGLARSCKRNGIYKGVMSARCAGLASLPKRFRGDAEVKAWLASGYAGIDGNDDPRSVFDLICPPSEIAALAVDGIMLGVGCGQLVEVEGLDFPLFQHLDPDPLEWREYGNTWVFQSNAGPIQLIPGQSPLCLYTPGGRNYPWRDGIWPAVAKACTRAEHAGLGVDEWLRKFAAAARVATAPISADDASINAMHEAEINWGNSSIVMKEGWKLELLQCSADGAKVFLDLINQCHDEITINIAGQSVTTGGGSGAGLVNMDIFKTIRGDLIRATAQQLADFINSQILPAAIAMKYGEDALDTKYAFVEYDISAPRDLKQRADALGSLGNAVTALTGQSAASAVKIDIHALMMEFGVPLLQPGADSSPVLSLIEGEKQ